MLVVLLHLGAFSSLALSLLGFLSGFGWPIELACHFRVQYFWGLLVVMLAFILLGRKWSAAICAIGALANFAMILPFYLGQGGSGNPANSLRFVTLNVHTENHEYQKTIEFLAATDADLVLLLEVDRDWVKQLAALAELYPYQFIEARMDNFGVALFSKSELHNARMTEFGGSEVPTVVAELKDRHGRSFRFIGTHPLPPVRRENSDLRNAQLKAIGNEIRNISALPTLLAGDLNVTPWSSEFGALVERAELSDSAQGFGVQGTWPVDFFGFLRIPIDHVLYSAGIEIVDRRLGGDVGSDHLPVIVEFEVVR